MDGDFLKKIQHKTFYGLSKLEVLQLSNNMISHIENVSFIHLTQLRDLNMHANKLKEINKNNFYGLQNLKKLSLHQNLIEKIETGSFATLTKLEH